MGVTDEEWRKEHGGREGEGEEWRMKRGRWSMEDEAQLSTVRGALGTHSIQRS